MQKFPGKLQKKLQNRKDSNAFRELKTLSGLIDFSSNDYLGFATSQNLFERAGAILASEKMQYNGATGSRLLSGNHMLYDKVERQIAQFHDVASALIFNSGYDANVGFFSSVPQRGDVILYDELCHASIRDGITMSHAKSYKYAHNDLKALEKLCGELRNKEGTEATIYVVSETVFSMDGDRPQLKRLIEICKRHNAYCILDEAHAVGVIGGKGKGYVQDLNLQDEVFTRIVTFGKALGCHGAAILSSNELREYMINFTRSFIYTTALPPHALAGISAAYETLEGEERSIQKLHSNIAILHNEIKKHHLSHRFIESQSAIHSFILPGNDTVKQTSAFLGQQGFDVRPILSPTVPEGKERLRICIHSFNSETEIQKLVQHLATFAT